jgi:hypothetical protein
MKRNGRHNMNTTLKTAIGGLGAIIRFSRLVCLPAIALLAALSSSFAQTATPPPDGQTQINTAATEPAQAEPAPPLPAQDLVAPIALYPDPLLIQVLAASTYPLEVIQLKQWLDEHKKLKDRALIEAVAQQNWDPSVQALAVFPVVVNKLANKIQWTTDLGNAFLAQESDVMDAVQRLRAKAQENGALKSNDKQKVATETRRNGEQAITIEPARRDVVYVPTYNTEYVYRDSGSSGYSGDSDYSGYSGSSSNYDYSYIGYAAAAAAGAAYGYYWGDYNWRDGYAEVNYNNYYNSRYNQNWNNKNNNWSNNVNNSNNWSDKVSNSNTKANNLSNQINKLTNNGNNLSNRVNNLNGNNNVSQRPTQGTGRWQHDPSHRGNAPYANRDLANRFGQSNNRPSGSSLSNRTFQPTTARAANQLAQGNRPSQGAEANAGNQVARNNLYRATGGARPSTRPSNAGAPNRVGNRMPSNWPNGARGGAFGPSNGNLARAFSGRGAQSMAPSRMGPPQGLRAGGPPMGGGFHGGPPMGGGFHGGPPMGGPPMGGGLPGGGAPPPPPPPAP